MRQGIDKKYLISLILVIALTICIFFVSLCVGRYSISLSDCISILLRGPDAEFDGDPTAVNVIFLLRLPRTLASLLIGMALSVSGLVYQTTFNNKLISPDILGVSSGACVGAATAIMLHLSQTMISCFAFVFGLVSVGIALLIPKLIRSSSNLSLVLSGVIINSFMNSAIGLLKFLADPNKQLADITFWIMGSIAGVRYSDLAILFPIVSVIVIFLFLLRWKINVISEGEENAQSLGMDFKRMRLLIIICSTLLTASTVCISGAIGWVGLIIPHISRFAVGEDHRKNIPFTIFAGGLFMMAVDLMARSLSMNEIPLSIISGFIGTPLYIILLARKDKGNV